MCSQVAQVLFDTIINCMGFCAQHESFIVIFSVTEGNGPVGSPYFTCQREELALRYGIE